MKKLLLILLCLPIIGFGQQTYVPDDNFEQALINLGYDNVLDDYVTTANINTATFLDVSNQNISDLTGIEGFAVLSSLDCGNNQILNLDVSQNTALIALTCNNNQLTSIDVSTNTALTDLGCFNNQLTSLDVSGTISLTELYCSNNQLTSIDVSTNTALTDLGCNNNHLTSLDVSQNTALFYLNCENNQLTSLDLSNNINLWLLTCGNSQLQCLNIANGNNVNLSDCYISFSPLLYCIEADDSVYMNNNWQQHFNPIDSQYYFSNNCSNFCSSISTLIQEHSTNKELLKVTDLLGRETKGTKNEPLLYLYDDGTVEKRIIVE